MTERLLQFIWQFQYYSKGELFTTGLDPIRVNHPGNFNHNQGPDFIDARISIANTIWAGHVELHLRCSDWNKHHHQEDPNYRNVILHVVWENDCTVNNIPVLELKGRVANIMLEKYDQLLASKSFIPCESMIANVPPIIITGWLESLTVIRMDRRSATITEKLKSNDFHWEETFWWMLARNFGTKVNGDCFESIARSIPLSLLAKHKSNLHRLESLLLGQAGLLEEKFKDDYPAMLRKEYEYLSKLYKLKPVNRKPAFLRMRPSNFPGIRLAQLAMLIQHSAHLFSKIKEEKNISTIRKWFDISASEYWDTHYRFDEMSAPLVKSLGRAMTDNIIINTVCPVLFAYADYYKEQQTKEKALNWLRQTSAESNIIMAGFEKSGIKAASALDSQALLELKNEYCDSRRCLDCAIGCSLIPTYPS